MEEKNINLSPDKKKLEHQRAKTSEFVVTNGGNILTNGSTFPADMTLDEAMKFIFLKTYYPSDPYTPYSYVNFTFQKSGYFEVGERIGFRASGQVSYNYYLGSKNATTGVWNPTGISQAKYYNRTSFTIEGEEGATRDFIDYKVKAFNSILSTATYGNSQPALDSEGNIHIPAPSVPVTFRGSSAFNAHYRMFVGALDKVPTTEDGEYIRETLLDESILGPQASTASFFTGTENRILVVADPYRRNRLTAINDGTKEVLTFTRIPGFVVIPDAGGDPVNCHVHICEMAVPFLTNAKINLTFG